MNTPQTPNTPSQDYQEALYAELQKPIYHDLDPKEAAHLANQALVQRHETATNHRPSPFDPTNPIDNLLKAFANLED
jgi:hypothetical protein